MKKVLLLAITFFFALTLTGCFLEPDELDDINDITSQFCIENPDSELCQEDVVGDLTEESVLNVFNTIQDNFDKEYDNAADDTFCQDYFAATNSTLFAQCESNRADLFPDDFEGYSFLSLESAPSLSTEESYVIEYLSEDNLYIYTFNLSLTVIDDNMYIKQWSYSNDSSNPTSLEVPIIDAKLFFEEFISDFLNTDNPSVDFCIEYFPNDIQNDCIDNRNSILSKNPIIEIGSFVEDGDNFKVEISQDSDETVAKTTFEIISFSYTDLGEIVMNMDTSPFDYNDILEPNITIDELKIFFTALLSDFQDSTQNIDDVCSEYFVASDIDLCLEGSDSVNENNITQSLVDIIVYEDHHLITIKNIDIDGNEEIVEVEVLFIIELDNIKVQFLSDIINTGPEYELISSLVAHFNDLSVTPSTFCPIYFSTEDSPGCIEHITTLREGGYTAEIGFFDMLEENLYIVEFIYTVGNSEIFEEQVVKFYLDVNGDMLIEFDDYIDENIQTYQNLFTQFILDSENEEISNTEVCNMYFEENDYTYCMSVLINMDSDGISQEIMSVYPYEDYYIIEIMLTDSEMNSFETSLDVIFLTNSENEDIKIHVKLDDENQQSYRIISYLTRDFNNLLIDTSDLCNTYFEDEHITSCIEKVSNLRSQGYQVFMGKIYNISGEYFEFDLIYLSDDDEFIEMLEARIYLDVNGDFKIEFTNQLSDMISFDEAYNYLLTFANDLQILSTNNLCITHFVIEDFQDCINEFSVFENGAAYIDFILHDNLDYFTVVISYELSGDPFTIEIDVIINTDADGNYYIKTAIKSDHLSFADKELWINSFINDINNLTISDQEICSMYLYDDSYQLCYEIRNSLRENSWNIYLYNANIEEDIYWMELQVVDEFNQDVYYIFIQFHLDANYITEEITGDLFFIEYFLQADNELVSQEIGLIFDRFNDSLVSNTDYCDDYGMLFTECDTFRTTILNNNQSIQYLTYNSTISESIYYVTYEIFDDNNDVVDMKYMYVDIRLDLDGNIYVMGYPDEDSDPNEPNDGILTLEEVNLGVLDFMEVYFDGTLDLEEAFDYLGGDFNYELLINRDNLLSQNYSFISSMVYEGDNPFSYSGTISLQKDDITEEYPINIWIIYDIDNIPQIRITPSFEAPTIDEVNTLAGNILSNIQDSSYTLDIYCTTFFKDYDSTCEELYDLVNLENYSIIIKDTYIEYQLGYILVGLQDENGDLIKELLYAAFPDNTLVSQQPITAVIDFNDSHHDHINSFLEELTSALNDGTYSITEFCSDHLCYDSFTSDFTYDLVLQGTVYTHVEVFNEAHMIELIFERYDGSFENHYYEITWIEVDNVKIYHLEFHRKEISIPDDIVVLDIFDTTTVIYNFINDIIDESITNDELCNTYFNGSMMSFDCIEGRANMITLNATVEFTPLIQVNDDNFGILYKTTFTITYPDSVDVQETHLIVYSIPNSQNYIIEFIEEYEVQ